jgi:hypothetical protein
MLLLKALLITSQFQYCCLNNHNTDIMLQLIAGQKRVDVFQFRGHVAFRMFYWGCYDYIQLYMCRSFITEENIVTWQYNSLQ